MSFVVEVPLDVDGPPTLHPEFIEHYNLSDVELDEVTALLLKSIAIRR